MSKKKSRTAAAPSSTSAAPASNHAPSGDGSAQTILDTTSRVFRSFHTASRFSAVLFGYVREQEIFKQAGCEDMESYARQHLGIESVPMYKKIVRASKAGWKHYREHFNELVQRIIAGNDPLAEENITLPSMTALALLSTALKSVPEEERNKFLADVLKGKIRAEDMVKRDRTTTKKNSRTNDAPDSASRAQVPDATSSSSDTGAKLPPVARAFEAMRAAQDSLIECSEAELSQQEREELQRQAQELAELAANLLTRLAAE
jgi:hypothetical protein